jgi:hypothetical protein
LKRTVFRPEDTPNHLCLPGLILAGVHHPGRDDFGPGNSMLLHEQIEVWVDGGGAGGEDLVASTVFR